MPRLSREEIAALESRLVQWQSADAMSRIVDETMDRIGSTVLFNQSGLAVLRDAWTAAKLAKAREADRVRLIADNWPDFELEVGGGIEKFEAVEADDPERRRGDEYRNATGEVESDPVENWIARAESAPAWLAAACKRKVDKRYSARANLVILLNLSEYGIRQNEVESCFASATATAKDCFDAVWILWKERAYLVWRGGEQQS